LPSDTTRDFATAFSRPHYDSLTSYAKQYNTTGHLLPPVLRDLFPALADRRSGVQLANEMRGHLGLPAISHRTDRVALLRALAQMRERLYVEIYAAIALPLAPLPAPPPETDGETTDGEGKAERPSLALTPSSLRTMASELPAAFPQDRAAIKAFYAAGGEYGEAGEVVWRAGVGSMRDAPSGGKGRAGYRGEVCTEPGVHIFVDQ
jgi:hypothetical protein